MPVDDYDYAIVHLHTSQVVAETGAPLLGPQWEAEEFAAAYWINYRGPNPAAALRAIGWDVVPLTPELAEQY